MMPLIVDWHLRDSPNQTKRIRLIKNIFRSSSSFRIKHRHFHECETRVNYSVDEDSL